MHFFVILLISSCLVSKYHSGLRKHLKIRLCISHGGAEPAQVDASSHPKYNSPTARFYPQTFLPALPSSERL